ncbi:hypothetical protein L2E82_01690 [Cichorium intybus]|uniref:Uncharacterized protein n=1 Tax=Cichorium intybus TaxID=13427 RepID=A0ACB9GZJ8_CICIN|nr:hypothetical protein L2E82_01690 [Cichorium intybus]
MEEREEGGDGFRTVENLKEIAFTENYLKGEGSGPVMTATGRKCLRVVPMVVQKNMDLKSTVSEDDDGGNRSRIGRFHVSKFQPKLFLFAAAHLISSKYIPSPVDLLLDQDKSSTTDRLAAKNS